MKKTITLICTLLVAIVASAAINHNLNASVVLEKKPTTAKELDLNTVGIRQAVIGQVEMTAEVTMEEWNAEYVAKRKKAAAADYDAHDYYFTEGMMHFGYTPQFYGLAESCIAVPYLNNIVWTNYYGPTDWYDQYNNSLVAEDSKTYVTRYGLNGYHYLPYTTDHTLNVDGKDYQIKGYKYAAGNGTGGYLASAISPFIMSTGEQVPLTLCGMETDPMNNESGADFYQIGAGARGTYAYGTELYTSEDKTVRADTILSLVRNVSPLKINAINIPVYSDGTKAIMPNGAKVKIEILAADIPNGKIYENSILAEAVATADNLLENIAGKLATISIPLNPIVVEGDFALQITGYNESGCNFGIFADYYTPGGTTYYKVGGKYTPIFSASSNLAISYDAYWPVVVNAGDTHEMTAPVAGGYTHYGDDTEDYGVYLYTNVYDVENAWAIETPEWITYVSDATYLNSDGVVLMVFEAEKLPANLSNRRGVVTINADGYTYQMTITQGNASNTPSAAGVSYQLNGGVTNDDNWLTKNDMFQACMADCGVTGLATLDEVKADADPFTKICGKLLDVSGMLNAAKWDWLEAYIMSVQNADANATALYEGTTSAGWRYAVAAFFLESQRTSWPKSADFLHAGTPEAFMPVWKHGFANPTEPTAEFVLNAPYREGATFDGWYAAPDFSGNKVTTINSATTGTLYAKWVEYICTVAEIRTLDDDTEAKTAGVVNFISGKSVYIQDATGGILIYTSETPMCNVGDYIIAKGVKVIYGGIVELTTAVIESIESGKLYDIIEFENLSALIEDASEHKCFAKRVRVPGVRICNYDSYNNPTVQDDLGNQALCYRMVLDPNVFPVGTKVDVTAVAAWYNGFQFVGDAAGIVKSVAGKKENYTYPARAEGKYSLENNWVISNVEDNFAANKPGSNDYVRGMAAKDGIMYFINRETRSLTRIDAKTGDMLAPLILTGEHLFEVQEEDGTWKSGVAMPFNDIKFDQAGNCLIGALTTGATKCETFFIYIVDLATGVCTKLIEDYLWDNPRLNEVKFRFDTFGVAGDVTKDGVVMAADANGSWNVYRWMIEDGVAGEGEQVAVIIDPAVDQSLFVNAAGYGTAPQIFPQGEEGDLFYVDGFNTLPMLFYGNPKEGGILIDDFINVPSGFKVWNNPGDTISINHGHNGLVEFQVGDEYFLLMAATNNTHNVPSTFALYKFADEYRLFSEMEPLWYFPHNGMGSTTNGCRTAVPSVEVISDTEARLCVYTNNNGYASYTLKIDSYSSPSTTASITVRPDDASKGSVTGGGTYNIGDYAVLRATPKTGYQFSHWNDYNTDNPRTVEVTGNKTYTAYFTPKSYQITVQSNNSSAGTVSGSGTYEYGSSATISATPKSGYYFSHWNDYNTDNPRTIQVTGNKTYTAYFYENNTGIPTKYDLAGYYEPGQLCVCIQFLEEVCNDIVFAGSYNGWNTDPANMEKFSPLPGFDGWYYVAVTDASESIEGKPVQLQKDGSFSWDYQGGDVDAYTVHAGTVDILPGYFGECDLKGYSTAEPVIMTCAYFKYHNTPCIEEIFHDYVVYLNAPFCAGEDGTWYNPAIIGSFNGWSEGVACNGYSEEGEYIFSIHDKEGGEFKFRALETETLDNPWDNQIQLPELDSYGNPVSWYDNPNYRLGAETIIHIDYSNGRFTLCASSPSTATITVNANDYSMGYVTGGGTYEIGDYIEISAYAYEGYYFSHWNDGSTSSTRTVEVTGDQIYTAYFTAKSYQITVQSNNSSAGTVTGSGTYEYGSYATISATPKSGYYFSHWNDRSTLSTRTVEVTGDKTYTAYFYENTPSTANITVNANDYSMGYVTGGGTYNIGDYIEISAHAYEGYYFSHWNDGNISITRTVEVTGDQIYTAYFYVVPTATISVYSYDESMGTVTGGGTYVVGDYVEISAQPNYGYYFSHWDDYNTDNPRTIEVEEDVTYIAYFYKNTYSINVDYNSAYGWVNAPTSAEYLDEVTLEAIPYSGVIFAGWSDGVMDNPRSLVVTQDVYLYANFAPELSGQCGDDLYWKYHPYTYTLSITGSGDMYHYTSTTQPWVLFKDQITKVEISNHATSIGVSAFEECYNLSEVYLGTELKDIYDNAFASCYQLSTIYCYPNYPPTAEWNSFTSYDATLYVPCSSMEEYQFAAVWSNFINMQCLGAESGETPVGEVTITTTNSSVTITWPTDRNGQKYIIVIQQGDEVFCTLTFNKDGQLTDIAFAPGRDGQKRAQYAELTNNGLRFTVTNLSAETNYAYNITSKDNNNYTIRKYKGEFTTDSDPVADVDNIHGSSSDIQKLFRDGQLLIIRDGKTYNAQGMEL